MVKLTLEKKKIIREVCLECGRKNDRKHKSSFGVWIGNCDMCGAKNVSCASAAHDFGIYSNQEIEHNDKFHDLI